MKAAAARMGRDSEDLRFLYAVCGFQSVEEALDCVTSYYSSRLLTPKTELLLREVLETGE